MFRVSQVRVHRLDEPQGKVLAFATITICGCFVVKDLRVVEGSEGPFVAMPQRKVADGSWQDMAHPITREAREMIQDAVLRAYRQTYETGAS